MTPEEAKQNAEVMLAYSQGKLIQFRAKEGIGWYLISNEPSFCFHEYEYRIKPEPKRFNVWMHKQKKSWIAVSNIDQAQPNVSPFFPSDWEKIEVVEVTT